MTDLDDLDLFAGAAPGLETPPRRCKRHSWVEQWQDAQGHRYSEPLAMSPTRPIVGCSRCPAIRDPERSRRNKNNGSRGKRTSRDLADYLGPAWQNVEGMQWPWDVQGPPARLQSKRLQGRPSANAVRNLIGAIPPGDFLRGTFWVAARQRLTSGLVTLLLSEWQQERGWDLPPEARLINAGVPLIELPVATFRDLVG